MGNGELFRISEMNESPDNDLPFIDVNSFSPPLSITRAEIDEGVDRYVTALNDALPALHNLAS